MRSTLIFACLGALLLGCSAGGGSGGNSSFGAGGSGASGGGGVGAGGPGSGGAGQGGFDPAGSGGGTGAGGMMGPSEVFAEGPDTLYKLDPDTKVFTKVADFSGCHSVLDIAIDKDGVMYGTTTLALFKIDKQTGVCTHIANGNYPNSLSLVPKGTVDPNEEALVGYEGNQYVRIDKTTGAVTNIGSLQNGYSSSGDIVSVINGGTYLTVNGNGCGDCIIQVNPATGDMMQMIGPLGHASVFGLAFWAGSAYGLDDSGELFEVDLTNGSTTPIQPGGLSVPQFWGAGSTTSAPVVPH